jgi:hypothetical protein
MRCTPRKNCRDLGSLSSLFAPNANATRVENASATVDASDANPIWRWASQQDHAPSAWIPTGPQQLERTDTRYREPLLQRSRMVPNECPVVPGVK